MFKTFPEFTKLALADKAEYESCIRGYPPYTDLSFAGLMAWWNMLDSLAVSRLQGNLVISYWLPGDEINSGLCLVGEQEIDEAVCAIFDYLKVNGRPPKLVHVPDFVIKHMRYPDLFRFIAEPDYDESVYSVKSLCSLDEIGAARRKKIQLFMAKTAHSTTKLRSLDLSKKSNQETLTRLARQTVLEGKYNALARIEEEAIEVAISQASKLGTKNICLYVDGELYAFLFYELPEDKEFVIATFTRSKLSIPGSAEFIIYAAAEWFRDKGFVHMNFEQDLGLPDVRAEKLSLGPAKYLRKYTIVPA